MPRRPFGSSRVLDMNSNSNSNKKQQQQQQQLPSSVSIVGLGCSSFSTFFWTEKELRDDDDAARIAAAASASTDTNGTGTTGCDSSRRRLLHKNHPRVQEWIETILYAINDAGITLLDTAPWYGHGSSEKVVGWALEELFRRQPDDDNDNTDNSNDDNATSSSTTSSSTSTTRTKDTTSTRRISRKDLIINTKVGRYEADVNQQFDFSAAATLASVERSLERLQCGSGGGGSDSGDSASGYIDVLQLHDPEFAPSLEQLLTETVPAMMECRDRGYCRALGLTGYSLAVQYQIFQRSLELYGKDGNGGVSVVWDQSLTYGHFNLHDRSLVTAPGPAACASFAEFCETSHLLLLAAAPLSMGLLTGTNAPPAWHPAPAQLQQACREATDICTAITATGGGGGTGTGGGGGVQIATLALCVALCDPRIPCTILGMKNVAEVQAAAAVAQRLQAVEQSSSASSSSSSLTPDERLQQILTSAEQEAWEILRDPVHGPFAKVWSNGSFQWDGLQEVRKFWQQVDDSTHVEEWQKNDYSTM
jgi:L-galactose dehydrogenase